MRYVLYIISIILITMFLIYLGYMKEKDLTRNLINKLYAKCRQKILKQLKTRDQLTALEIRNLISDVTASVIWSRKRLGVTKPVQFTNSLIKGMLKDGKIIEVIEGKNRAYRGRD